MENQTQPQTTSADDGKTIAIVSYLTVIGFIVAIIMHGNNKTSLGAYHLRQMLAIVLAGVAIGVVLWVPFLGWIAAPIAFLGLMVLWVFGLIAAANGEEKPMPLLGEKAQEWFATTFK
ncbi:MAG: hypothetical protein MUD08_18270 [Cytophagales bacterium]|jgi:uncharacterized membrane protein|nr:hypothetical protein [Cytophagales bacterium]